MSRRSRASRSSRSVISFWLRITWPVAPTCARTRLGLEPQLTLPCSNPMCTRPHQAKAVSSPEGCTACAVHRGPRRVPAAPPWASARHESATRWRPTNGPERRRGQRSDPLQPLHARWLASCARCMPLSLAPALPPRATVKPAPALSRTAPAPRPGAGVPRTCSPPARSAAAACDLRSVDGAAPSDAAAAALASAASAAAAATSPAAAAAVAAPSSSASAPPALELAAASSRACAMRYRDRWLPGRGARERPQSVLPRRGRPPPVPPPLLLSSAAASFRAWRRVHARAPRSPKALANAAAGRARRPGRLPTRGARRLPGARPAPDGLGTAAIAAASALRAPAARVHAAALHG